MAMNRIRVVWTGFTGSPGVSTFYSLNPAADLPLLHGYFTTVAGALPNAVTLSFEGSGDIIDETTGDLTGSWSATAPAPIAGTGGTTFAGPSGICVSWMTGVVMDARRLKGKTYLVPTSTASYDGDGTLDAGTLAAVLGASVDLAEESQLVVWHRPRAARAANGSIPAVTARAGGYASMTGAVVRDVVAVLTSRRD